jgi:fission process protein 1
MWWGKSPDKDKPTETPKESTPVKDVVDKALGKAEKTAKEFDPDHLPEGKKLPRKLQKIMDKADKEDSFYGELVEG